MRKAAPAVRGRPKPATPAAPALLAQLKKLGKPNAATIYRRHGATGEVWGVSFADLNAFAKRIKTDHALAVALWDSGVIDAQTLALMVADPAALTPDVAEAWLAAVRAPVLLHYLALLVARTPFAPDKAKAWAQSPDDFTRTCGYSLMAALLARDEVSDADCRKRLAQIEQTIHASPNRARHAMNLAVIAIGVYKPTLQAEAIAAARRIGKVEVDHGETGCKTPDAEAYILKANGRKKARTC